MQNDIGAKTKSVKNIAITQKINPNSPPDQ